MKFKIRIGIVLLVLLSSCSTPTSARKTIANASEQVGIKQGQQFPALKRRKDPASPKGARERFTMRGLRLTAEGGQMLPITAIAEIGGETIELEVAKTPEQQATGLMFRESLADNRGMLFPFQYERTARFWMKNVPISLDIIFLNGDRIVGIAANVPGCQSEPCPVYGPEALVDRVIELRGGRAEELGIEVEGEISIKLLSLDSTNSN